MHEELLRAELSRLIDSLQGESELAAPLRKLLPLLQQIEAERQAIKTKLKGTKLRTDSAGNPSDFGTLPFALARVDRAGRILQGNAAFFRLVKTTPQRDSVSILDYLQPLECASFEKFFRHCLKQPNEAQVIRFASRIDPNLQFTARGCASGQKDETIWLMLEAAPADHERMIGGQPVESGIRICHLLLSEDRRILKAESPCASLFPPGVAALEGEDCGRLFMDSITVLEFLAHVENAGRAEQWLRLASDGGRTMVRAAGRCFGNEVAESRYLVTLGYREDQIGQGAAGRLAPHDAALVAAVNRACQEKWTAILDANLLDALEKMQIAAALVQAKHVLFANRRCRETLEKMQASGNAEKRFGDAY